jgi:hypothetical protein
LVAKTSLLTEEVMLRLHKLLARCVLTASLLFSALAIATGPADAQRYWHGPGHWHGWYGHRWYGRYGYYRGYYGAPYYYAPSYYPGYYYPPPYYARPYYAPGPYYGGYGPGYYYGGPTISLGFGFGFGGHHW